METLSPAPRSVTEPGAFLCNLNPAQQAVLDHGLLDSGFNLVLQMPTGSGKTWLARYVAEQAVAAGKRAIFLSPLRALADELRKDWQDAFGETKVGVFTGDYGQGNGTKLPVSFSEARVLIMTPERLTACTRNWRNHWHWLPEVDWLIVDELHLLGDSNRGANLEGAVSRLQRLNPFARVLGLSATLGNRDELATWLNGIEFESSWRPIPLTWRIETYPNAEEKPNLLAHELHHTKKNQGQALVFVQSRRRAETLATEMIQRGIRAAHHHAGLTQSERQRTEAAFRQGRTDALIATGTLEMGLNLPARQVILYDLQGFDGTSFTPLPVNTIWQRAGRAGRRGLDETGEAVLFAAEWDRPSASRYLIGKFEPIQSQIGKHLSTQILAEVDSGLARTLPQLERAFNKSLMAYQEKASSAPITERISVCVQSMIEAEILLEDDGKFNSTPLGRIASRHHLSPQTVLTFRRVLDLSSEPSEFDWLVLLTSVPDCDPVLPVDFEELENLADELARQPSTILQDPRTVSALLKCKGKRFLAGLKTAIALWRWTELGEIEAVCDEDNCYPFELQRILITTDRLLLALTSVCRWLEEAPEKGSMVNKKSATVLRLDLLRQKLRAGLSGPASELTLVPGIGPIWAENLMKAGIKNLSDLSAENWTLPQGLSQDRANLWRKSAQEVEVPPAIQAPNVPTIPPDMELAVDPYRLRRALELQVTDSWIVSGGSEPRRVTKDLVCSCPDYAKGTVSCKHVLAVKLEKRDPVLIEIVKRLKLNATLPFLDLFQLWFEPAG